MEVSSMNDWRSMYADGKIRQQCGKLFGLSLLAACESLTMTPLISTAKHARWSKHEFDSARG